MCLIVLELILKIDHSLTVCPIEGKYSGLTEITSISECCLKYMPYSVEMYLYTLKKRQTDMTKENSIVIVCVFRHFKIALTQP